MRLPDELFASIVGCNTLHMEKGKGADRRRQGRVRVPARIHIIPISKQMAAHPISAQVRDLSHDGIGLLLPKKLAVGENLLVRLMAREAAVWVFCDVARVEKVAEGLFVTGATFSRIVQQAAAAEDFHAMLPRG